MSPAAQQLASLGLVLAAVAYLVWRWRTRAQSPACDKCGPRAAARSPRGIRSKALRVLRGP